VINEDPKLPPSE
jgi:GTPase SAR1 family protein